MSANEPCGADYVLESEIRENVLYVAARQVSHRAGECALNRLACCSHPFTVELPAPFAVNAVHDRGHPLNPIHFLTEPPGLLWLDALPDGWELRQESATWGGTWTRIYSPEANPQPGWVNALEFSTTFGGEIVIEPEALQPEVTVNGRPATYHRYPGLDEISLQWLVADQKLSLLTAHPEFTIEDLIRLAESASPR